MSDQAAHAVISEAFSTFFVAVQKAVTAVTDNVEILGFDNETREKAIVRIDPPAFLNPMQIPSFPSAWKVELPLSDNVSTNSLM